MTLWLPDGRIVEQKISLGGRGGPAGGRKRTDRFQRVSKRNGIHRIKIILTGLNDMGQRVSRTLDRTFRVAEFGKGVDWKEAMPSPGQRKTVIFK